jgi:hypothetical protein
LLMAEKVPLNALRALIFMVGVASVSNTV